MTIPDCRPVFFGVSRCGPELPHAAVLVLCELEFVVRDGTVGRVDGLSGIKDASVARLSRELNEGAAIADPDLTPVVMPWVVVVEALAVASACAFTLLEYDAMSKDSLDAICARCLTALTDIPIPNPEIEGVMFLARLTRETGCTNRLQCYGVTWVIADAGIVILPFDQLG